MQGQSKRARCSDCGCTFLKGEDCSWCEQHREFNNSIIADDGRPHQSSRDPVPRSTAHPSISQAVVTEPSEENDGLSSQRATVNKYESKRVVCSVCDCTYLESEDCLRCEQGREFESSRIADARKEASPTKDLAPLSLEEVRSRRISLLSNPDTVERVQESGGSSSNMTGDAISLDQRDEPGANHEQDFVKQGQSSNSQPERLIILHRTYIKSDLIENFKDPSVMNCNVTFKIINERGELELGVGIGVTCEVYTLFWNEFAISMTIGDRERVPFVIHDHFVEEWDAVGGILVKGFQSV